MGFTLIELLVVTSLIGILMAILIPATKEMRTKAKNRDAVASAKALESAIRAFRAEYGYWPTAEADSTASVLKPSQTALAPYLLATAKGTANPKKIAFWDIDGVVSNQVVKRALAVTINVTNDTVSVEDWVN